MSVRQHMAESETIVAPATPQGKSALAILRISGTEALKITALCIKEKNLFERTPARYIRLYTAKDPQSGETIDQITAIKYFSPQSFTGENMAEIICHGGKIIPRKILSALINAGARSATGGEFTRRALLNGKIKLLKAEGIRGLIECNSETEFRCAQKLYSGTALDLEKLRKEIIEQLEHIEMRIEFEETETISAAPKDWKKNLEDFLNRLKKDIEKREKSRVIENGIKIVIAGPVNAGKSTLFNKLVGKERVIVHKEPGTTRDVISEQLWLHGHEIQLFDSAGIRKTGSEIEKEGIDRSREAIKGAGIIIWVTAADEKLSKEELQELVLSGAKNATLCIINKIDKNNGKGKMTAIEKAGIETILISLKGKRKENIENLVSRIVKKVENIKNEIEMPDMLLNTRHEEIGKALVKETTKAINEWERPEIAAVHLKKGLSYMDEFFGYVNSEEVINNIFKDFCIGK
jgi:tRNA modification GTPase